MQPTNPSQPLPENQPLPTNPNSMSTPEVGSTPAASETTQPPPHDHPSASATPPPVQRAIDDGTASAPSLSPSQSASSATPPPTAADVDLIEKPWVEQAERIIDEKRDDPKAEDTAEQSLNKQYLKQRFNFDVDNPDQ